MGQRTVNTVFDSASGEAQGAHAPAPRPPTARPGETPIDGLVGLIMRAALAVQFFSWAAGNAVRDGRWDSWIEPEPGLVQAASVWTMGFVDPGLAAFALLAAALLLTASMTLGLATRLAGLLTAVGALWHALFVLPEAWPSALGWGALGVYLALRGAGPASLDWALARLSRLG